VIHDVCIQGLHVVFCLDRAGLVGADGATHHGAYDIAYMRCLPNMVVASPMNEEELRDMMFTAQLPRNEAFTIRYPRGNGVMPNWKTPLKAMQVGKGRLISEGEEIAILSFGHIGNEVQKAINQLVDSKNVFTPAHYDMRFAKPLDEELLHHVFTCFDKIITIEDGCIQGGFGSAILEFAARNDYRATFKLMGIPDEVVEHGEPHELQRDCSFDVAAIVAQVKLMSLQEAIAAKG
jgi:1-deoxy-D-xylulose-5-phosphate synthase